MFIQCTVFQLNLHIPSVPLQSNECRFDDDSIPAQLKSLRKDFPGWRFLPETQLILWLLACTV